MLIVPPRAMLLPRKIDLGKLSRCVSMKIADPEPPVPTGVSQPPALGIGLQPEYSRSWTSGVIGLAHSERRFHLVQRRSSIVVLLLSKFHSFHTPYFH